MSEWSLEMTFRGPHGERYAVAVPVDGLVARERYHTPKPRDLALAEAFGIAPTGTMDDLVEVMRRREFRKVEFQDLARQLGALLAERMEDKEGWHGIDRQENLKDWGR